MNKTLKVILEILLAIGIVAIVYAIYSSIMQPVNFQREQKAREAVGIQRLKDIRDLEVAFKSVHNRFTADPDSLVAFYNTGKMEVVMQIGSKDDSLAVENTARIKKANKKITNEQLYELYKKGENLVFSITSEIPVKDTLFRSRENFVIDSVIFIPYSGGKKVELDAIVKTVSGVEVPLFEARMPYRDLLKGLDNQLRINLDADREAMNKFKGLQAGSITAPNNNAGNWE